MHPLHDHHQDAVRQELAEVPLPGTRRGTDPSETETLLRPRE